MIPERNEILIIISILKLFQRCIDLGERLAQVPQQA